MGTPLGLTRNTRVRTNLESKRHAQLSLGHMLAASTEKHTHSLNLSSTAQAP
jgi:hypothetical protein